MISTAPRRDEPEEPPRREDDGLEPRLEVEVQQRALTRIDTTRQVHSEQTVHERCAHPCTAHRPARVAPGIAVARPTQVVEHRGAHDRELLAHLPTPKPVRVP